MSEEIAVTENMQTLLKVNGLATFLYEQEEDEFTESSFSANVYEVISWDGETDKPEVCERYLRCRIKWDGCSHLWFGDEDGYMHICGVGSWELHNLVMSALLALAKSKITKWSEEVAGS